MSRGGRNINRGGRNMNRGSRNLNRDLIITNFPSP